MTSRINRAILSAAGAHLGKGEWPGAASNPEIEAFFAAAGMPRNTDDVPWCAAFVGAVLSEVGLKGTGRPNARSYLDWGSKVSMHDAVAGDIVVLTRGDPKGWQGHVGFLVRFQNDRVILRGGNQSNRVSDAAYPIGKILGFRRADVGEVAAVNRPRVLRTGMKGSEVRGLQEDLARLRYFTGALDGNFGPRTRAAVVAFQADHELEVDGVVGPRTREKLDKANPRPLRDVTEKDLRDHGSRTIAAADQVRGAAVVLPAGGAVLASITQANEIGSAVAGSSGWLATVSDLAVAYWPAILLLGAGAVLWYAASRIAAARVSDAVTGANDRL